MEGPRGTREDGREMKYWLYEINRMWRMFNFWQWLANRLPKKLCYFAYIRIHAHATCTEYRNYTPNEVTWDMALKCWENTK